MSDTKLDLSDPACDTEPHSVPPQDYKIAETLANSEHHTNGTSDNVMTMKSSLSGPLSCDDLNNKMNGNTENGVETEIVSDNCHDEKGKVSNGDAHLDNNEDDNLNNAQVDLPSDSCHLQSENNSVQTNGNSNSDVNPEAMISDKPKSNESSDISHQSNHNDADSKSFQLEPPTDSKVPELSQTDSEMDVPEMNTSQLSGFGIHEYEDAEKVKTEDTISEEMNTVKELDECSVPSEGFKTDFETSSVENSSQDTQDFSGVKRELPNNFSESDFAQNKKPKLPAKQTTEAKYAKENIDLKKTREKLVQSVRKQEEILKLLKMMRLTQLRDELQQQQAAAKASASTPQQSTSAETTSQSANSNNQILKMYQEQLIKMRNNSKNPAEIATLNATIAGLASLGNNPNLLKTLQSLTQNKSGTQNSALSAATASLQSRLAATNGQANRNKVGKTNSPSSTPNPSKAFTPDLNDPVFQERQQAVVREVLKRQLENVPVAKAPATEMHFIPNPNNIEFVCYAGLEKVVDFLIGANQSNNPPEPFECVQCGTDYTPTWKWINRDDPSKRSVICEACVNANVKRDVSEEYATKLKTFNKNYNELSKQLQIQAAAGTLAPPERPAPAPVPQPQIPNAQTANSKLPANLQALFGNASNPAAALAALAGNFGNLQQTLQAQNQPLAQQAATNPFAAALAAATAGNSTSQLTAIAQLMQQAQQQQTQRPPAAHSNSRPTTGTTNLQNQLLQMVAQAQNSAATSSSSGTNQTLQLLQQIQQFQQLSQAKPQTNTLQQQQLMQLQAFQALAGLSGAGSSSSAGTSSNPLAQLAAALPNNAANMLYSNLLGGMAGNSNNSASKSSSTPAANNAAAAAFQQQLLLQMLGQAGRNAGRR